MRIAGVLAHAYKRVFICFAGKIAVSLHDIYKDTKWQ